MSEFAPISSGFATRVQPIQHNTAKDVLEPVPSRKEGQNGTVQSSYALSRNDIRSLDSTSALTTPIDLNVGHVITTTPAKSNALTAVLQGNQLEITFSDNVYDQTTGNYLGNVYFGLNTNEVIDIRSKDCAFNFHKLVFDNTSQAENSPLKVQLVFDVGVGKQEIYAVDIEKSIKGNYSLDLAKLRSYSKVGNTWVYGTKTLADLFLATPSAQASGINFGVFCEKPGIVNSKIFLADMSFSAINAQTTVTSPQPGEFISSTHGAYDFKATLNRPADVKRVAYVFFQSTAGKLEQKASIEATIPDGKTAVASIEVAKLGLAQGPVNLMVKTWDSNGKEYFSPTGVTFNYSDLAVIHQPVSIPLQACSVYAINNSTTPGSTIEIVPNALHPAEFDLNFSRLQLDTEYNQSAGLVFPIDYNQRFQSTADTCLNLEVLADSSLLINPKIQLGIQADKKNYLFETAVKLLPVYKGAQPGKQIYSLPLLGFNYIGYLDEKYVFTAASDADKQKTVNDMMLLSDNARFSQLSVWPKYTKYVPPRMEYTPSDMATTQLVPSTLKISSVKFDPSSPGLEITSPKTGQASWSEVSFSWKDTSTGNASYLQFTDKSNGRISHLIASSNPFTVAVPTGEYEVRVFDRKPDATCIATNNSISISVSNPEEPNYKHYTQSVYGTLAEGETVELPNEKVPVFVFNGNSPMEVVTAKVSKNEQGSRGLEATFPQDVTEDFYVGGVGVYFPKEQWPTARRNDGYLKLQSAGKMWSATTASDALVKVSIQIKDINSSDDSVVADLSLWVNLSSLQATSDGQGEYIDIPLSSFVTKDNKSLAMIFLENPGYAPAGIVVVPHAHYGGKLQLENISLLPYVDEVSS